MTPSLKMVSKSSFMLLLLLVLHKFDPMDSIAPPPIDIIKALTDAKDFNIFSSMISASGVISELNDAQHGAGVTLFMPTDYAFLTIPDNVDITALPADKKCAFLRFHVLHAYYSAQSLNLLRNPAQPTLATEGKGPGRLTLDISKVNNGSVLINTGTDKSFVTHTILDQNPVSIFGISKVLLPSESF